jgi:MinD superfamily P-loop ATPase
VTIAVASGKGGTGKTTVALGLALSLPGPVTLLDCDVEAPNAHLFLGGGIEEQERFTVPVPRVDEALCTGCGACATFCAYGALAVVRKKVLVIDELCHSCGGCRLACPHGAIHEIEREIGSIETRRHDDVTLITGKLDIGETLAPAIIREIRSRTTGTDVIIDAPPGTTCPVVESIRGADLAVLVTENTPFGLHDLDLAATVCSDLGVPSVVVLNRSGIGYPDEDRLEDICDRHGLRIGLRIPYSERVAVAYARGGTVLSADRSIADAFMSFARDLRGQRTSGAPS